MLKALLLGTLIGFSASVAYSQQPPRGAVTDNDKPSVEVQQKTKPNDSDAATVLPPTESVTAQPPKPTSDDSAENLAIQRRIADETGRLALYTKKLAAYTGGLIWVGAIGSVLLVAQLFFFRRSIIDTGRSADAAAEQAAYLRAAERAHITGGFGDWGAHRKIFPSIDNYGKTPGFITRIAIAIKPLKGLPPEPDEYQSSTEPGYVIGPNQHLVARDVSVTWDGKPGQVFYGRIWYTDTIDRAAHESGFILHLNGEQGMPGVSGFPKYWHST